MSDMRIVPMGSLGSGFVPAEFLPAGKDEHYLRNEQCRRAADHWRHLKADEIETLVKNGNTAANWDRILVTDAFRPHLVKNCEFYGLVRIGRLDEVCLEHHELTVPVGLTNSRIVACDFGDNVAVHNVPFLGHYIIGDRAILLNVDEMHTSNHAKFGNGTIKQGEDESVRIAMDLINEAGGRDVLPFDGMICADAALWAMHPADGELRKRLSEITQKQFDPRRGYYGTIGEECVIKNSGIVKDVKIGPCCYIKGANKLKNLTINSAPDEPTQIGEGCELVNGIIGYGCHVFYGVKAVRFVLGNNSSLKYGARLIHSVLGDNSTISCCEVLNDLIFPAHEQHHNNSFLIASLVMGQSNIAAGATIGSNHNSRAPDGEVHAGRGFWPGLCVSVKHNSKFASFTLLAKGDYPCELNVALPFALVNNNVSGDCLELSPAWWWRHNMYALARNTWKFGSRDKRKRKVQKIEFDSLAPDTGEEIFAAMDLLADWTAKAWMAREGGETAPRSKLKGELVRLGHELLMGDAEKTRGLEVVADGVEKSERKVVVLKAREAYHAYRQMLVYYAMGNLLSYMGENPHAKLADLKKELAGERQRKWMNLGGQLIARGDLDLLMAEIKAGRLDNWADIHGAYDKLWEKYPSDKRRHALATLLAVYGAAELTDELWNRALDEAVAAQQFVCDQTYASRKKDFESPFRRMVYASDAEMEAVLGSADRNSFVKQVRRETEEFTALVAEVRKR